MATKNGSTNFGELFEKGRSREKTPQATSYSHETLRQAEAVVEAAEADPEQFGDLQEQMDETEKVSPATLRQPAP